MARPEDLEIDLEGLLGNVRKKLRRRQRQETPGFGPTPYRDAGAGRLRQVQDRKIDESLNLIRRYSRIRTKLPRSLDRFPINRVGVLRKLLLKSHEILFREQRAVNNAIADALAEFRRMNEQSAGTASRVGGMEASLKALEARTNNLHAAALSEVAEERRHRETLARECASEKSATEALGEFDSLRAALVRSHRDGSYNCAENWNDYLATVRQARGGTLDRPLLDLGCGRGDWLAFLKQEDLHGRGVDSNRPLVEESVARGLQAENHDAVAYLGALPDGALGAVTGFHVIEHLPFATLVRLLDHCLRVLQPGGVAIFEAHDPDCLLRAWYHCALDPVPRHLLAAPVLKGLAELRGFSNVEIRRLHPVERPFDSPKGDSHLVDQLNAVFGGPRAYAVVGYKP